MSTTRGFVSSIEVGRAGLVTVALMRADGGVGQFVIQDIDADPERFNERLTMLGLLRDAVDRAEPVSLEHAEADPGEVISAVRRITRDAVEPALGSVRLVEGVALDLTVIAVNEVTASGERHDHATVSLLATDLSIETLTLDLQAPERHVTSAQLEMLREAQAQGRVLRVIVASGDDERAIGERVVGVALDVSDRTFGDREVRVLDGFVESLGLLPVGGTGTASLAVARLTTAPAFDGPGGTTPLESFSPRTVTLLVPRGSLAYELYEAALRDNLRTRARVVPLERQDDQPRPGAVADPQRAVAHHAAGGEPVLRRLAREVKPAQEEDGEPAALGLCFETELLAPLASAARPVWVHVERGTLDQGPAGEHCTPGLPTSDLSPRGLRDLRIPYPAVWRGWACCNPGVYRFEVRAPSPVRVLVDGEELCLFDTEDGSVQLGHACLGTHAEIVVEIEAWTCDDEFNIDAYRLR